MSISGLRDCNCNDFGGDAIGYIAANSDNVSGFASSEPRRSLGAQEALSMHSNTCVLLLGFAGTGKLTIAQVLAPIIGARIVDNHWINNPIFGLVETDRQTPLPASIWDQTQKVREAVFRHHRNSLST